MRLVLSAVVAATVLAVPALAHAATMDSFVLTGAGNTVTFSLPAMPTPFAPADGFYFGVSGVSFVDNGATYTGDNAFFYNSASSGGFDLEDQTGAVVNGLSFTNLQQQQQLYAGTEDAPTFVPGTFSLTDGTNNYTLVISPVATTPEPGTLALLGTGVLGAAGALRRRSARS